MRNVHEVFTPDFQQTQAYHQELLKQAQQERLALQAMKARNKELTSFHGQGWLQRLLARRHSQKFARTATHSSNVNT